MKLNLNLFRILLMYIEENADGTNPISNIEIDGYIQDEVIYHLRLMLDGNLFIGETVGIKENKIRCYRLTLKGHQYLESIKEKYIWEEIKKQIELKGFKNVSLDILKDYANKLIRNKLGI